MVNEPDFGIKALNWIPTFSQALSNVYYEIPIQLVGIPLGRYIIPIIIRPLRWKAFGRIPSFQMST